MGAAQLSSNEKETAALKKNLGICRKLPKKYFSTPFPQRFTCKLLLKDSIVQIPYINP